MTRPPRRPSPCAVAAVSRCGWILGLLLAGAAEHPSYSVAGELSSATTTATNCLPHGCPLFPLDVIYDEPTRNALDVLRRQQQQHDDPEDEETKEARGHLSSAGNSDRVVLTLRGYKGGPVSAQINQDSSTILSPFHLESLATGGDAPPPEEEGETDGTTRPPPKREHVQLLGVFDGHGSMGEITSAHAAREIPRLLAARLDKPGVLSDPAAVSAALVAAFVEADQTDPTGGVGGATATVLLQVGHKIYAANAGDSRSFVGVSIVGQHQHQHQHELVYATREDKPDLPSERERILRAGGYVHVAAGDTPRAYHVDPEGRLRQGLAMSRSIGDWAVQGVIAEPLVDVINVYELVRDAIEEHKAKCDSDCPPLDPLTDVRLVAVSASDGMMDFLEPAAVAERLAGPLSGGGASDPFLVAEGLVLEAAEAWDRKYGGQYRDDIVVAAATVLWDADILAAGTAEAEEDHDEL